MELFITPHVEYAYYIHPSSFVLINSDLFVEVVSDYISRGTKTLPPVCLAEYCNYLLDMSLVLPKNTSYVDYYT